MPHSPNKDRRYYGVIVMVESLNLNLTAHQTKQTAHTEQNFGQLYLSHGKVELSHQQATEMLRQQRFSTLNLFGFISPY